MIYFGKDIGVFSLFLVLYLLIDKGNQPFTHIIGRNEQLFEIDGSVWLLDKVKYCIYFPDNGTVSCHNGIVGIHTCISFVEVACTDTDNISMSCPDVHQFGVNLQPFHPEDYTDSCILHPFTPVDI